MDLKLEDKIVVITGGTGGIGTHIVLDFLKEKSTVILLYRNEKKKDKLLKWLKEEHGIDGNIDPISSNITDLKNISTLIKEITKKHRRIDVLVNCAGMAYEQPFLTLEDEQIEQMMNINFLSPMYLIKAVLRPMLKQKGGNIINISSLSTHAWGRGITVYASAKAALERFTKTIAQEVGKKNVRVNAVCPGVIDTEMSINIRSQSGDLILEETAMKKYGLPHEVSKAVLFLASDETASFITGHVLNVDGGNNL